MLKINGSGALQPLSCDFCDGPIRTTHVCREKIHNGTRLIEGTNEKICGLATCIQCCEKADISESERQTSCSIHSNATSGSTVSSSSSRSSREDKSAEIADTSLPASTNEANATSASQMDDESISTFTPNYVNVLRMIEALYSVKFCKRDEGTEDDLMQPGFNLLYHRAFSTMAIGQESRATKIKRDCLRKRWEKYLNIAKEPRKNPKWRSNVTEHISRPNILIKARSLKKRKLPLQMPRTIQTVSDVKFKKTKHTDNIVFVAVTQDAIIMTVQRMSSALTECRPQIRRHLPTTKRQD